MTKVDLSSLMDPFADKKLSNRKVPNFMKTMAEQFYSHHSKNESGKTTKFSYGQQSYKIEMPSNVYAQPFFPGYLPEGSPQFRQDGYSMNSFN